MSISAKATAMALLVALLLTACGGGDGSVPTLPGRNSDTNRSLTPPQIRAMMPTRRELNLPLWGVMSPAERVGGPMDNRHAARDTDLWSVSREDFERAGRLGGYVQYYWDGSCGGACLGRPLLSLNTEAHIFPDDLAASRFLRASASRFRAANGEPGPRCTHVTVHELEPAAIGDEAVGFRTEVGKCRDLTGYTWRSTIFLFRVGRIVCLASATSLNDKYPSGRASAAADILERRVEAVLSAA